MELDHQLQSVSLSEKYQTILVISIDRTLYYPFGRVLLDRAIDGLLLDSLHRSPYVRAITM